MNLPNTGILSDLPKERYFGDRRMVYFREIMESDAMKASTAKMPIPLGMREDGTFLITDFYLMTNILICGSTATGKSVLLSSVLSSLLMQYTPDELKLCLIDPKRVELTAFDALPHLLTPIVHEAPEAIKRLEEICDLMEERFERLEAEKKRNYRELGLPAVVVVIDELSDLFLIRRRPMENALVRLLQKGRAAGIYIIASTQRVDRTLLSPVLRQNFMAEICFFVPTRQQSKLILGVGGAETLSQRGEALMHLVTAIDPIRVMTPYISDADAMRITEYWSKEAEASK